MRKPDSYISGRVFGSWKRGVFVYGWRRGEQYLYIGVTSGFFRRMGGHGTIDQTERVNDNDVIDLWFFSPRYTREASERACEFERAMIAKYRPKYNIAFRPPNLKELNRMLREDKERKERAEQWEEERLGWSRDANWD